MGRKPMSQEEKEFWRETFIWFEKWGVERGFLTENWKKDLAKLIWTEMQKEGKEVKLQSVYRNLNRMISYYFDTGAQARSGRTYLPYIEKIVMRIYEDYFGAGGEIAKYFLTYEEAKLYQSDLSVLHIVPDPRTKTIVVIRYYGE
ncbi:MAG: hypothetical protein QXS69_02670 [Candidatus Aenigmatarchaeota archaeon]